MRAEIANRLSRSQRDFLEVVWPVIEGKCGEGTLIPVESVTEFGFAKQLDTLAGIDVWQMLEDDAAGRALRGIATRVQWGSTAWDTFTVRRSVRSGSATEYAKRCAALDGRGLLYPHLTIQAYVDSGALLSVGIAETREVIAAVKDKQWRLNPDDQSTFYWVPFSDVRGCLAGRWGAKAA